MIAFVRLAVFGLLAMVIAHALLWIYFRSVRREELEKEWDARYRDGGAEEARDTYIEAGLEAYRAGLTRKLLLLVYVIPAIVVAALIYLTNYW